MNKEELSKRLVSEGVPLNAYSLDGGWKDDTWCLQRTPTGWEVYYTERGVKYESVGFASEEDACDYFYDRIKRLMNWHLS